MKKLFTIVFLSIFSFNFSQEIKEEIIVEQISASEIKLSSIDTPLTAIAGAPAPFYSYWWEFGDGNYSQEDQPTHTYNSLGNFNIYLARTNNYNDGKGRPGKKKMISNPNTKLMAGMDNDIQYLEKNKILDINNNHSPKPNEEIVFAQTYKNLSQETQKGILLFFYNEKSFHNNHFVLKEKRTHYKEKYFETNKNELIKKVESLESQNAFSLNNENINNVAFSNHFIKTIFSSETDSQIQSQLSFIAKDKLSETKYFGNQKSIQKEIQKSFETYNNVIAWDFDNLSPEEERNLFLTFKSTNEMLEDTNVSISVKSFFIPNNYDYATRVKKIMPIVTAHDPNKLIVNKNKTFRSFSKKKGLEYEIKFQNVGKGPAEEVKLRFYNNAAIDIKNLEILDFEPKCNLCKENCKGSYLDTVVTKDYVEFYFHNIYLPGTRQKDIEKRKASKGFVKFVVNTEKNVKQNNLTCRTEIYFDKEDPIKTNQAKTRLQKRFYFGIEAGGDYLPIGFPKFNPFLRLHLSYRITNNWYYRAELGTTYNPEIITSNSNQIDTTFESRKFGFSVVDSLGVTHTIIPEDSIVVNYYSKIEKIAAEIKKQSIKIDFVPLEFRRDISNFLSIGFGIHSTLNLISFSKTETKTDVENYDVDIQENIDLIPITQGTPTQTIAYEVLYSVNAPDYSINASSYTETRTENTKNYNLDFSSGLFLDVNIGKLYAIPYVGVRAKVDYNFMNSRINPALQLYLGANF